MNELMILSAKYLYLLIIIISLVFIFLRFKDKNKEIIRFSFVSLPLSLIIAKILGYFFYNTRPFVVGHFTPLISHIADNGFPSDHALLSFALAALIFVFNKKLGITMFLMGILVGISRVYVGIHSPIDIFGSFVISVSVAIVVYNLFHLKLVKKP